MFLKQKLKPKNTIETSLISVRPRMPRFECMDYGDMLSRWRMDVTDSEFSSYQAFLPMYMLLKRPKSS